MASSPMEDKHSKVARSEGPLTNWDRRVLEILELVTKEMAVAVACCSRDFQYIWANQEYADFLRQPLDEIIGRSFVDVVGSEAFEALRPHIERVLTGQRDTYEAVVNYKGIGPRWISTTRSPIFDANGEVTGWVAVVINVTERKRAEDALRRSDERFRLAARTGKMFAYEWDVATDVIERSGGSAQILGIDEAVPFTGQQAISKVHPEDRESVKAAVAQLSPQNPYLTVRYRMVRPDDTVIWVERSSRACFNDQGQMLRVVGMVVDITERRRSEEALRRSACYLAEAERLAHIGSWAWDVHTRETFWSREMFRILGYDPEKTRPSLSDFLARVHPDDRIRAEQQVQDEASGVSVVSDYRIVLPDGTIRHLQAIGEPVKNESGEVIEVVGTTIDVTDRKLAEQALSTVSQKLIDAQEQERSRISRELHDDINQRLALLAVTLDRVKRDLPSSDVELGRRVGEANQTIADLTRDVQNLSHQLHSPKLELLGLASAAASFCRELSDRQGVEIDFHSENVPKELIPEISLPLFRVLQEAVQNSIKHSGSRNIRVSLKGGVSEVELAVHDSGIGFQLEEAIRGRGLGLTSMIERLKLADGRLFIDSNPRNGTTLYARVPVNPKRNSAATA